MVLLLIQGSHSPGVKENPCVHSRRNLSFTHHEPIIGCNVSVWYHI